MIEVNFYELFRFSILPYSPWGHPISTATSFTDSYRAAHMLHLQINVANQINEPTAAFTSIFVSSIKHIYSASSVIIHSAKYIKGNY